MSKKVVAWNGTNAEIIKDPPGVKVPGKTLDVAETKLKKDPLVVKVPNKTTDVIDTSSAVGPSGASGSTHVPPPFCNFTIENVHKVAQAAKEHYQVEDYVRITKRDSRAIDPDILRGENFPNFSDYCELLFQHCPKAMEFLYAYQDCLPAIRTALNDVADRTLSTEMDTCKLKFCNSIDPITLSGYSIQEGDATPMAMTQNIFFTPEEADDICCLVDTIHALRETGDAMPRLVLALREVYKGCTERHNLCTYDIFNQLVRIDTGVELTKACMANLLFRSCVSLGGPSAALIYSAFHKQTCRDEKIVSPILDHLFDGGLTWGLGMSLSEGKRVLGSNVVAPRNYPTEHLEIPETILVTKDIANGARISQGSMTLTTHTPGDGYKGRSKEARPTFRYHYGESGEGFSNARGIMTLAEQLQDTIPLFKKSQGSVVLDLQSSANHMRSCAMSLFVHCKNTGRNATQLTANTRTGVLITALVNFGVTNGVSDSTRTTISGLLETSGTVRVRPALGNFQSWKSHLPPDVTAEFKGGVIMMEKKPAGVAVIPKAKVILSTSTHPSYHVGVDGGTQPAPVSANGLIQPTPNYGGRGRGTNRSKGFARGGPNTPLFPDGHPTWTDEDMQRVASATGAEKSTILEALEVRDAAETEFVERVSDLLTETEGQIVQALPKDQRPLVLAIMVDQKPEVVQLRTTFGIRAHLKWMPLLLLHASRITQQYVVLPEQPQDTFNHTDFISSITTSYLCGTTSSAGFLAQTMNMTSGASPEFIATLSLLWIISCICAVTLYATVFARFWSYTFHTIYPVAFAVPALSSAFASTLMSHALPDLSPTYVVSITLLLCAYGILSVVVSETLRPQFTAVHSLAFSFLLLPVLLVVLFGCPVFFLRTEVYFDHWSGKKGYKKGTPAIDVTELTQAVAVTESLRKIADDSPKQILQYLISVTSIPPPICMPRPDDQYLADLISAYAHLYACPTCHLEGSLSVPVHGFQGPTQMIIGLSRDGITRRHNPQFLGSCEYLLSHTGVTRAPRVKRILKLTYLHDNSSLYEPDGSSRSLQFQQGINLLLSTRDRLSANARLSTPGFPVLVLLLTHLCQAISQNLTLPHVLSYGEKYYLPGMVNRSPLVNLVPLPESNIVYFLVYFLPALGGLGLFVKLLNDSYAVAWFSKQLALLTYYVTRALYCVLTILPRCIAACIRRQRKSSSPQSLLGYLLIASLIPGVLSYGETSAFQGNGVLTGGDVCVLEATGKNCYKTLTTVWPLTTASQKVAMGNSTYEIVVDTVFVDNVATYLGLTGSTILLANRAYSICNVDTIDPCRLPGMCGNNILCKTTLSPMEYEKIIALNDTRQHLLDLAKSNFSAEVKDAQTRALEQYAYVKTQMSSTSQCYVVTGRAAMNPADAERQPPTWCYEIFPGFAGMGIDYRGVPRWGCHLQNVDQDFGGQVCGGVKNGMRATGCCLDKFPKCTVAATVYPVFDVNDQQGLRSLFELKTPVMTGVQLSIYKDGALLSTVVAKGGEETLYPLPDGGKIRANIPEVRQIGSFFTAVNLKTGSSTWVNDPSKDGPLGIMKAVQQTGDLTDFRVADVTLTRPISECYTCLPTSCYVNTKMVCQLNPSCANLGAPIASTQVARGTTLFVDSSQDALLRDVPLSHIPCTLMDTATWNSIYDGRFPYYGGAYLNKTDSIKCSVITNGQPATVSFVVVSTNYPEPFTVAQVPFASLSVGPFNYLTPVDGCVLTLGVKRLEGAVIPGCPGFWFKAGKGCTHPILGFGYDGLADCPSRVTVGLLAGAAKVPTPPVADATGAWSAGPPVGSVTLTMKNGIWTIARPPRRVVMRYNVKDRTGSMFFTLMSPKEITQVQSTNGCASITKVTYPLPDSGTRPKIRLSLDCSNFKGELSLEDDGRVFNTYVGPCLPIIDLDPFAIKSLSITNFIVKPACAAFNVPVKAIFDDSKLDYITVEAAGPLFNRDAYSPGIHLGGQLLDGLKGLGSDFRANCLARSFTLSFGFGYLAEAFGCWAAVVILSIAAFILLYYLVKLLARWLAARAMRHLDANPDSSYGPIIRAGSSLSRKYDRGVEKIARHIPSIPYPTVSFRRSSPPPALPVTKDHDKVEVIGDSDSRRRRSFLTHK